MALPKSSIYGDALPPAVRPWERVLVAAAVLVVGTVNVFKPVHIDDALYLAIAKQVVAHPLDPYGFEINWQHTPQPAYAVSISPPLLSYYHALWLALGADAGLVLHVMMIPWLALLAWSVAALLRRISETGSIAAAILLVSPAVFAGTNLMLDVPMTACLTAAVEWLLRSVDRRSFSQALLSGLLAAASVLIKYPAVLFVGVCVVVSLARREWRALIPACCCLAAFGAWQWASHALYGAGQVRQAAGFLEQFGAEGGRRILERSVQQLALLGATFPIWIIAFRHGHSRLLGLLAAAACTATGAYLLWQTKAIYGDRSMVGSFLAALFLGSFSVGELLFSALRRPYHDGTVRFAAVAWLAAVIGLTAISAPFVAVRYLLPALPALMLLHCLALRPSRGALGVTLFSTAAVGTAIALADLRWAQFYPATVAAIRAEHPHAPIFFSGHWGFQWYAERQGMKPWDQRWVVAPAGAIVVVAERADPTPIHQLVGERLTPMREYILPAAPLRFSIWRPTRSNEVGVCLHGWEFPHLPWGFSSENAERISVYRVR